MLGRTQDATQFGQQADEILAAFNVKFLDRADGRYDNGTQTSCVLPLEFGMVPSDMVQPVFNHLVEKITGESKNHIGTGLVGGQHLNQVLSNHGRADLAYAIATQKDYPSWGYMISQGATTIWELWNGNTADPAMNSHNHVMLVGDLGTWFYEYLAGIRPDDERPGFKHIIMRPHPVGDLNYAKASFRSPHGTIRSQWRRDGQKFDWQITIPVNVTATIYVPAKSADTVTEGGRPAREAQGVQAVRFEDRRAVFEVGSGEYRFASTN